MGLFDSLLGAALGGSNKTALMQAALGLVTNHSSGNGLAGLVQQFEQAGLGNVVQSWVGSGQNQPITGDQVQQALGSDQIQALSAQTGLQGNELLNAIAQILPHVVDHLTPNGQVPQGGDIQQGIASLLQKFGAS